MDFVFFKFTFGKHLKNLLIRRSQIWISYLQMQVKQLFRFGDEEAFAMSYWIEGANSKQSSFAYLK